MEYYFKGEGNYLTFPWDKGLTVEAMEHYYDRIQFSDWTHTLSKAPMIKAQHPDWEIFQAGIHAKRGLSCADCHMPYTAEGGVKYSDHQIVSPLKNINKTCQVCHRETEAELRRTVYERQDKNTNLRRRAEALLVKAHVEAGKAWALGVKKTEIKAALTLIRHAQWRWDFVAASHGASFHSPIESARIMATAIDKAQEARLLLARMLMRYGFKGEVPDPDISTKAKAQAFIGLDMAKLKNEKALFIKKIIPQWLKKARDREADWDAVKK